MTMKFADYTKGFRSNGASDANCKRTTPRRTVTSDPEIKNGQLRRQMAGISRELLNLRDLSDTDRRLLNISSAVAFLLAGR